LATNAISETDIWKRLLELVEKLPPELCEIVANYSPESPVWRYSAAVRWPPDTFSKLHTSRLMTLSPHDLPDWTRGTKLPRSGQIAPRKCTFVRIVLDDDGIRQVEFLTSWPKASASYTADKGVWYIVETFDQFSNVQFHSRVRNMSRAISFANGLRVVA
jgi:hypothetical protein